MLSPVADILPPLDIKGYSNTKRTKIEYAFKFCEKLSKKNILFLGISGSVSYEPDNSDDVDIFIITRDGKLWLVFLHSLIIRRFFKFRDICLSLNLDHSSACQMFCNEMTPLRRNDARHVIPVFGKAYYEKLLKLSRGDMYGHSEFRFDKRWNSLESNTLEKMLNMLVYLFISPVLFLKSLAVSNRENRMETSPCRFDTRLSQGYFYFDSQKYRNLSKMYEEGGSGDTFSHNILK